METKGGDSLVEAQKPYGTTGGFGEAALRAGFEYDSRGRTLSMTETRGMAAPDANAAAPAAPSTGVRLRAEGFFVPQAWDVTSAFGGVDGSVAGYLGNERLVLAARVGGRKLWGPYPWFESASVSGDGGGIGADRSVRGYYGGRFRGDASAYGNAELRWWIGHRRHPVLPVRWGVTTFCESGRVWYEGESSKKWHTGYGLGLLVQLIGTPATLGGSVANGSEGVRFYVSGGYAF